MKNNTKIFTIENFLLKNIDKKEKNIFFVLPYVISLLWIFFSLLSIPIFVYKYILNPFVIFSIIIKILISIICFYFIVEIYFKKNRNKRIHKLFESFTGYGIVFTYVFYSFPRIVVEFYEREKYINFLVIDFIIVTFITVFPVILYLLLISDKTRLAMKTFTKEDLAYEKRMKKDKKFKKEEMKKIRKERGFLKNLWYDWIDLILQAILIVIVINQFLFQLYGIPSESMVPTFLINDLVVVDKLTYGPQIPLTQWKLPAIKKPKVGDIVVFINPETYNRESDVAYKNIFARIFQPFIYRLTFTKVDIDKKPDGSPKERFIVKRMIAGKDEKICILNDKVYKKKSGGKWYSMENNEVEYGYNNLYIEDIKGMHNQRIDKNIRSIIDETVKIINETKNEDIIKELNNAKNLFKSTYNNLKKNKNIITKFLEENRNIYFNAKQRTISSFEILSRLDYLKYDQILYLKTKEQFPELLNNDYKFVVFYNYLKELTNYLDKDLNIENINTNFTIDNDLSPYKIFMKKANFFNKLYLFSFFNELSNKINNINYINFTTLDMIFKLSIYFDGLDISFNDKSYYYSFFELSNFEDFPKDENQYLKDNQYFMLGDNRYNSLDCRFTENMLSYEKKIDEDDYDIFAKKVKVSWSGRVIEDKFVIGKAIAIYFPFNRLRVF